MSDFLHVTDIAKSFPYGTGTLQVLQGISFSLERGAVATIVGESGSGKSTLLHILGGMERPDQGAVEVNGTSLFDLDGDGRAAYRNREIGFVFQFHHLLPEFNTMENLVMPLLIRGRSRAEVETTALNLLEEVGLAHRVLNRPGELSGGEQQRLAIGRALIAEPSLLLMDEPTGNLDHRTSGQIMDLVFRLARTRQITTILVTHNPELARTGQFRFRMTEGCLTEDVDA